MATPRLADYQNTMQLEKVYRNIQKVAAKKGLVFLILIPDITAKVFAEPVDLFEVLDVKAGDQATV
jgi:hypothetical protein